MIAEVEEFGLAETPLERLYCYGGRCDSCGRHGRLRPCEAMILCRTCFEQTQDGYVGAQAAPGHDEDFPLGNRR